ncbi:CrcB family protein [Prochlorococcus sp. AH-716-E13]|nr:CrcB family protein [Prochlorococcus sp. AH-716-E13]
MRKKYFIVLFLVGYFATFLRFYLNNNFIISIIGSFLYGFIFSRKISESKREILLIGFCSCFTSFSSFVYYLYQLIIQGFYLKLFFYLNVIVILNLIIMYIGFLLSRKIT